jgi:hypothetical protein
VPLSERDPIIETIRPSPAAVNPFSGARPDSVATMDMPNSVKASSSGEPIASSTGRRIGMLSASTTAPIRPPASEEAKPAPKARPASPLRAMAWPSITVAAAPTWPGTPNNTALMKSVDVMTAAMPKSRAIAWYGSML